jgi:uncharacterized protein (DUF934 family)
MARCGFDAFALPDGIDVAAWLASLGAISVRYQPATESTSTVSDLRRDLLASSGEREPPVVGLWAY